MQKNHKDISLNQVNLVKANGNEKRKTWFIASCCISGVLLIGTICYQFIVREFAVDSLLSTILALFSVGISILFYFKADTSSAKFYEKVYEFNINQRELLREIQQVFNYKIDSILQLVSELKNKEDKAQRIEKQRDEVDDEKKKDLLEMELRKTKEEIAILENKIEVMSKKNTLNNLYTRNNADEHVIFSPFSIVPPLLLDIAVDTKKINLNELSVEAVMILKDSGFIENDGRLTKMGYDELFDWYVLGGGNSN